MLKPSEWNVVIVDDDPDNLNIVVFVLEYNGALVRPIRASVDCVEELRRNRPTVVLLDLQMPKVSGWDLIQEIRMDTLLRDLPVIAVTAHAMSGDRERILEFGFDGYLSKPLQIGTLIDDIKAVLSGS